MTRADVTISCRTPFEAAALPGDEEMEGAARALMGGAGPAADRATAPG